MDFLEKNQNTNNFILEPVTVKHAKAIFDLLQPSELYTYLPTDPPKSVADLEAKYKVWQKRYSPDKEQIWLNYVILDRKDNAYKGIVQATIISDIETYIAYQVFPKFWKTGIAKECVAELINILFNHFKIQKITAHIDTRNTASLKLLESLEFKYIRKIEDADYFKGCKSDEFEYELEN